MRPENLWITPTHAEQLIETPRDTILGVKAVVRAFLRNVIIEAAAILYMRDGPTTWPR